MVRPLAWLLFISFLTAHTPLAQELQGWNQTPYSGILALTAGFPSDPEWVDVTAGGTQDVASTFSGCVGYISDRPDVVMEYSQANNSDLTISASSDTDVSLVVRTPGGQYLCDDDSAGGGNPMLTIATARTGQYRVWAGVFGAPSEFATTKIGFSEIGQVVSPPATPQGPVSARELPGWNLTPYSGIASLSAGFNPDPHVVDVNAGGPTDVANTLPACVGFISERPDVVMEYSLGGNRDLTISAAAPNDVSLVVRTPNGEYICDDDGAGGTNPSITIRSAPTGQYRVWAGVFGSPNAIVNAAIGFSEVGRNVTGGGAQAPPIVAVSPTPRPQPRPQPQPTDALSPSTPRASGAMRNATGSPTYGVAILNGGFDYDPRVIDVMAGGSMANPLSGTGCTGFVAPSPDAVIDYNADGHRVTFSAAAAQDLSLIVMAPNGSYYCDDDSGNGNNPRIDFATPMSGEYRIWVGTYAQSNTVVRSHLGFSETGELVRQ